MLLTFNYLPIISLISRPRIESYKATFQTKSDADLYGVYIWAQQASASLYPLAQNLEISLRNAIDQEAISRFGSFWWNSIRHAGNAQADLFFQNIQKAQTKLLTEWQKKERDKLELRRHQAVPTPVPIWTHDQIIAATDFSTWQFVLVNAFSSPAPATNSNYLWPISIGSVFKNYAIITSNQNQIRGKIVTLIKELRDYRNRLFHHEPIWTKDPTVVDARTAIDTVRNKINKMELLINAIDTRKLDVMKMAGVSAQAKRICSEEELSIYRYNCPEHHLTNRKKRLLRALSSLAKNQNVTVPWSYGNAVYGIYKIR